MLFTKAVMQRMMVSLAVHATVILATASLTLSVYETVVHTKAHTGGSKRHGVGVGVYAVWTTISALVLLAAVCCLIRLAILHNNSSHTYKSRIRELEYIVTNRPPYRSRTPPIGDLEAGRDIPMHNMPARPSPTAAIPTHPSNQMFWAQANGQQQQQQQQPAQQPRKKPAQHPPPVPPPQIRVSPPQDSVEYSTLPEQLRISPPSPQFRVSPPAHASQQHPAQPALVRISPPFAHHPTPPPRYHTPPYSPSTTVRAQQAPIPSAGQAMQLAQWTFPGVAASHDDAVAPPPPPPAPAPTRAAAPVPARAAVPLPVSAVAASRRTANFSRPTTIMESDALLTTRIRESVYSSGTIVTEASIENKPEYLRHESHSNALPGETARETALRILCGGRRPGE